MAAGADLTLVGKDMVRLVLGPNWSESGRIFELFGPGIGVMLLCSTVGWIHLLHREAGALVSLDGDGIGGYRRSLFVVALPWGPAGIAAAWSVSYWAFWFPPSGMPDGPSGLVPGL